MATLKNELSIDVYHFNSLGNAFVRKETRLIPLPAEFVPCSPGPDRMMRVYTKILYNQGGAQKEAYVGQTVEQLNTLVQNV